MNDTIKIINENISRMNFYKHEIERLKYNIEHCTDENYIRDSKLRIGDYEGCIECLQRDIKKLQKHYNKIACGICNTEDGEQNVYLNEDYDYSIMCAKQGSGKAYYVSSCEEFMNGSGQEMQDLKEDNLK